MEGESPSSQLYYPHENRLRPCRDLQSQALTGKAEPETSRPTPETVEGIETQIESLLSQKDYPCVAALKSYHSDEYRVGFYRGFGSGGDWKQLRNDLLYFLQEQRNSKSIYLTFWAIFLDSELVTEEEFEKSLWSQLSWLTSIEKRDLDWGPHRDSNPEAPGFCMSLGGEPFFVVGMHPNSSRKARKFPFSTLIFNVFEQFEELEALGQYNPMVKTNRQRDVKFQGSVNPMVLNHGDAWEAIQFSGKENPPTWKCPFHFLFESEKTR